MLQRFRSLLVLSFALSGAVFAAPRVQPVPAPAEMLSQDFTVMVNGTPVEVAHAAAGYDFVNLDITSPVDVAITAAEHGFWDRGVDIQPWRLGFRPKRDGDTIRFRLEGPAKLSISRPRDFLNHAHMLFLFAGMPPSPPPVSPTLHYYQPGIYRQSLNPKSGDTYYLAPGAFFFGSLNLWKVQDVKVMGRGTIIYDGPQDPGSDEGWMQKPDWHCIGMMQAKNIEIDGVTCVVRSRTWSVQMKDSSHIVFDDLRVIGGNPGNANQDGIDWIGSGDGVVRNAFLRASDDDIALMGNWDGYTDDDLVRPGRDVHDILVENTELSTSISNVVRAGWPRKVFNSRNFTLRNSDILHAGIGACGQPFGLLGFWGAIGAKGDHSNYTFENLFLDDWYSLVQMEQEQPALHGFTFRNIWALDQPPLLGSTISGQVSGVTFDNIKNGQQRVANNADIPLAITDGAAPAQFGAPSPPIASFTVDPPVFAPGEKVKFTAAESAHTHFTWSFGDGTEAHGSSVTHRFPDAQGTELDSKNGGGRFRVLLHAEDDSHREDWAAQGVVVVARWFDAAKAPGPTVPGLAWRLYPGTWTELPDLSKQTAVFAGESSGVQVDPHGFTRYATAWDGFIDLPVDGGYTFHLLSRDGARLVIDGVELAKTGPPFAQVCNTNGNALRYDRGSLGLRAGTHVIHLEALHTISQGTPRLLWEGPGIRATDVPPAAFTHPRQDGIVPGP